MKCISVILLWLILGADFGFGKEQAKLECSLIMPEAVINAKNPAQDKSLLLVLKIKNVDSGNFKVCTYRNGRLEFSLDGEKWESLDRGRDHVLKAYWTNFVRLEPGEAAYVLINCHASIRENGITLSGEANTGDFWRTKQLKDGVIISDAYILTRKI
jgi:hypothetical protein